jgi:hypothetical protein
MGGRLKGWHRRSTDKIGNNGRRDELLFGAIGVEWRGSCHLRNGGGFG